MSYRKNKHRFLDKNHNFKYPLYTLLRLIAETHSLKIVKTDGLVGCGTCLSFSCPGRGRGALGWGHSPEGPPGCLAPCRKGSTQGQCGPTLLAALHPLTAAEWPSSLGLLVCEMGVAVQSESMSRGDGTFLLRVHDPLSSPLSLPHSPRGKARPMPPRSIQAAGFARSFVHWFTHSLTSATRGKEARQEMERAGRRRECPSSGPTL